MSTYLDFSPYQKNSPDNLAPDVADMQFELEFVRSVEKGWPHVAKRFLKPFGAESPLDFAARQARTNFSDFLNPVADAAAGRIFRKEPTLTPDSGRAAELWGNIDQRGTKGAIWLRNLTRDALIAGQAFIFVDYPQVTGNLSRGQRIAENVRAYWVPVYLDQVTNFDFEIVNGKTKLTLFVFKEQVSSRNGFAVKMLDQWKVLRQAEGEVSFELWRKDEKSNEPVLYQPSQPITGITEIPVVSLNLRPQYFCKSRPVFIELAQQAVDYYLTTSDMSRAHEMTSYPTLFAAGLPEKGEDGQPLIVGPNSFVASTNIAAKLEYVNSDGKGVELGMKMLDAIRSKMAVNGLSFLETKTQMAETATAKALDKSTDNDRVQAWSDLVEDAANAAWEFTAQFEDMEAPELEFDEQPTPTLTPTALQQPDGVMQQPKPVVKGNQNIGETPK